MRALITEKFHPCLISGFHEMGIECNLHENISTEEVYKIIHNFEIIVINSKILMDKKMLDAALKLKYIARVGSGLDVIDLIECNNRQIEVISSPEGNANAVAEHTLAFLLSSLNNLYKVQKELSKGIWRREPNRGVELEGKTIAIIGFGHTGSQFARKLEGFDVKILVNDIITKESTQWNIEFTSLDRIYREADILSIHLPLNLNTKYYVNSHFVNKFSKPIYFINASRGKIVDTHALIEALSTNKILKAMLDVFENEPINVSEKMKGLMNENKLFLSPHIAGWSKESYLKLSQIIVEKLKLKLNNTSI